jgi:hypothetical protein
MPVVRGGSGKNLALWSNRLQALSLTRHGAWVCTLDSVVLGLASSGGGGHGAWGSIATCGIRLQLALEDAIGSHDCLQPIQQWVTEFMVCTRGCY